MPIGWDELRSTICRFVDVGTTKFVIVGIAEPPTVDAWLAHLHEAADAVLPLETKD